MKRIVALLSLFACLLLPAGCGAAPVSTPPEVSQSAEESPPAASVPEEAPDASVVEEPPAAESPFPMEFIFSSGAGAWGTFLTLNEDGSFSGDFGDSEMGDFADAYPNGTHYYCTFRGQFAIGAPLDDRSTPLTLTELIPADPVGTERIENGIRYISSTPYGLEGGTQFILYTPDTPILALDEELLSWWPGRFEPTPPQILNCYCLWNVEAGTAFFTYP